MAIFRSRKLDNAMGGSEQLTFSIALIHQKLRSLEDDIDYTSRRLMANKEEKVTLDQTMEDLLNAKLDLEATLEKLK